MMTRFKGLFFLVLFATSCFSQNPTPPFEGEITYSVRYKPKNPKLNEKQLTVMLGSEHHYFMGGGNYKTVTNGTYALWQLYVNKENRIYNKVAVTDTLFWNDGLMHDDVLISSTLNKNGATILGYVCDELVMKFRSGVHKYYYNSKLRVDANLFVKHKYGNYYSYVSKANAVPLKMIIEDADVIMESTATKVERKKLPDNFFAIPVRSKLSQNRY